MKLAQWLRPADWFLPTQGRLSSEDVSVLRRVGGVLPPHWRVGHLWPAAGEQRALPRFEAVGARQWDLSRPSARPFDALIAARLPNFADGSGDPLRRALASCRCLFVVDSTTAAAASASPSGPALGALEGVGPSRRSGAPLLGSVSVPGGELRIYRGDLTDPLLRVDDYPTGVRPILDDLGQLHEVLRRIDAAELPFHLGIVPAILEDRMLGFLRSLRGMIASMHGFDHCYPQLSKALRDAGDPFNQRGTVGGFDEFAGQSYQFIVDRLSRGRQMLESAVGQRPLSYIPPTNAANRRTGKALVETGFEYVLSERPVPGCRLPRIGSDFYDRSSAWQPELRPRVASLHATWEADLLRAGDKHSLPRFLAGLVEQRKQARTHVAATAQAVVDAVNSG